MNLGGNLGEMAGGSVVVGFGGYFGVSRQTKVSSDLDDLFGTL